MADPGRGGASFPVVFFDGDRELDVGTVSVTPVTLFRRFHSSICQKIGVAPHQISTSLIRRKKARATPEVRRRVPIDEGSDFAEICRERDCFVLAALRRSRRENRRIRRFDPPPPTAMLERTILRRGVGDPEEGMGMMMMGQGFCGLESLQRKREMYLIPTAAHSSCFPEGLLTGRIARGDPAVTAAAPVCVACELAASGGEAPPPFHWCVLDAVTVGFRSPAGPIQRPSKSPVESSA